MPIFVETTMQARSGRIAARAGNKELQSAVDAWRDATQSCQAVEGERTQMRRDEIETFAGVLDTMPPARDVIALTIDDADNAAGDLNQAEPWSLFKPTFCPAHFNAFGQLSALVDITLCLQTGNVITSPKEMGVIYALRRASP